MVLSLFESQNCIIVVFKERNNTPLHIYKRYTRETKWKTQEKEMDEAYGFKVRGFV